MAVTLFDDDPYGANDQQMCFLALLLHSFHWRLEGAESTKRAFPMIACRPRRPLLLGRPGAGKSYVLRCSSSIVRMLTNLEDASLVAGPTGIAAFQARGVTWHSLLSVPTGKKFT
eukprot:2351656-Prymnesium_polylepis.1